MNKILQLFSGGRDSFLSTCRLLDDEDNEVILVTYTNGCCIGTDNVEHEADRLICKYGNRVQYRGVYNVAGVWRQFFLPIMNMTSSDILDNYGEVTFSQVNCVSCRLAMYIYSIVMCKKNNIHIIADGARYSQLFVIELRPMLERIRDMLKIFDIKLFLPVVDLPCNWDRKNELLMRGFIPKTMGEQQCLIGVPLDEPVPELVINGVCQFYEKEILPRIPAIVDTMMHIQD